MDEQLVNCEDFERRAAELLEPGVHGYYAGGAGDERTLRDNVAAFRRHRLLPRVLVDVGAVDPRTTVLGREISMPVIVAPVALQKLAHADGERGMAQAAADAGTISTLSTLATTRPSDAVVDGPQWFQLYVLKDRGVSRALTDEAVASGFEAIVLTVDAPRAGRRERDLRTGFNVPPHVDMPAVTAAVGTSARITPAGFFDLVDRTLTWQGLEELASASPVPVIVKGVHCAEDARRAVDHGAAAVVVSNHGGRQLDNVPASLDMLGPVVAAVGGEVDVLVDGGVRRGTDVVVALALGAKAVLVGRPALWGLACGGQAGARRVLQILHDEVELALTLLGTPRPADVSASCLAG